MTGGGTSTSAERSSYHRAKEAPGQTEDRGRGGDGGEMLWFLGSTGTEV